MSRRRTPRCSRAAWLATLLVVATSAPATLAHADDTAGVGTSANPALAEALFREGRERMEAGAYADACPKLAESERLDPRIGTLLNLAFCHAKEGRTATAWGEYAAAAAEAQRAGRKENEASARASMRTLEAQLSRVVIVTNRGSGPPPGFTVKLDGAALGSGALGSALPVDPGHHVIEEEASGRRPARLELTAQTGPATATVTLPDLVEVTSGASSPPVHLGAPSGPPPELASGSPSRGSWTGPVILGGVAVAAAAVGTVFGLEAFADNNAATPKCPSGACTAPGLDLDHSGRVDATVSTVAFSVAAAAVVTGVVWLLAEKPWKATTSAGFDPGAAMLRGRF